MVVPGLRGLLDYASGNGTIVWTTLLIVLSPLLRCSSLHASALPASEFYATLNYSHGCATPVFGYLVGVRHPRFLTPFPVFRLSKFPCRAILVRVSVTFVFFYSLRRFIPSGGRRGRSKFFGPRTPYVTLQFRLRSIRGICCT